MIMIKNMETWREVVSVGGGGTRRKNDFCCFQLIIK
jgi:hypothetical protein